MSKRIHIRLERDGQRIIAHVMAPGMLTSSTAYTGARQAADEVHRVVRAAFASGDMIEFADILFTSITDAEHAIEVALGLR